MNERIQELAKDCGYQHKPFTSVGQVSDFEYFDLEKFAELIVRECIDAACEAQADFYVVHNIKTRFGVE